MDLSPPLPQLLTDWPESAKFSTAVSFLLGGAPDSSGPRVPLNGVDHEPAKIRRLGGLLLSCYVRATPLRYYALHSYSILYLGS